MHPDWCAVKRLLAVSLLPQDSQPGLHQVLPMLQQSLPQASITVLAESLDSFTDESLSTLDVISLPFPCSDLANHANSLIEILQGRSVDAAVLFTLPHQSPYLIAYCCYLVGIPIRVGQSCEFGGGVLSHCIKPPIDPVNDLEYQLHLLRSVGLLADMDIPAVSSTVSPSAVVQPVALGG